MKVPVYWHSDGLAVNLTTLACGGSLRYFAEPTDLLQLRESLERAQDADLPVRRLSGGSNLVFNDEGFQGLVIRPRLAGIRFGKDPDEFLTEFQAGATESGRYWRQDPEALALEGDRTAEGPLRLVEMEAAVPWGQAVQWTLSHSLHGLHRYARIPCRIGGAVTNNIHAGERLLAEHICAVRTMSSDGDINWYPRSALGFSYDRSRFQTSAETILSVLLALPEVGPEQNAYDVALYRDWTARKARVQPSGATAGSTFKNLVPNGHAAVAAAWYVDQCGLKGERQGGMQVYPGHANFIVNLGGGTQANFLELVQKVRERVFQGFGLWLEPEIECLMPDGSAYQWTPTGPQ
jgi:UDP-N-acetylmuramate dehydrogenase